MLKYRRNKNKIKKLSKQQRFDLYKIDLKSTFRDTGLIPSDSDWKYEKPNKAKSEEIFIYGVNSSGAAIVIRYMSLPQEDRKCLKTATLIYKDGEDVYDYDIVDEVKSEEEQSYKLGALDIQVISPFRLFRIVFRGILRKRGINGNDEHLFANIRMFWYPLSKVIDFKRDNKASFIAKDIGEQDINIDDLFEDRYEQYGALKGTIHVEKNTVEKIFLWGSKCKKFHDNKPHNNRTWKRMLGYSSKGLTFHFGFSIDNIDNKSFRYGSCYNGLPVAQPIIKSSLALNDTKSFIDCNAIKLTFVGPRTFDVTLSEGELLSDTLLYKKANINEGEGGCIIVEENSFINFEKLKDKVHKKVLLPESESKADEITVDIYNNTNSQTICGGKGASLLQLWYLSEENQMDAEISNFLVPRGLIVTTNAYSQFLNENLSISEAITDLQSRIWQSKHDDLKEECDKVVTVVSCGKLPDSVKSEIRSRLLNIFDDESFEDKIKFAVRSSACGEDSEEMSAAGQMSSFLGVKGLENIYASVVKCWASQFTHIAVQYKHGYGQLINTPMAVVIQEMVDCDVAGVLFTCNPLNGDPRKVTITANYGLCESVVSASVEPDTIIVLVDPLREKVEKVESVLIGSKKIAVKMSESEEGGTVETTMSSSDGAKCCIEKEKAIEITKVALFLRRCFGNERDIEWGIKNNVIYLLQSRPVTTLDAFSEWEIMHEMDKTNVFERGVVSKANVGEGIPGSMSFLGYGFTFAIVGVTGTIRLIRAGINGEKFYAPYFASGIVVIYNQVFFDINSWKLFMPLKKDSALSKSFHYSLFGHEVDLDLYESPDKRIIPPVAIGMKMKAGLYLSSEVFNSASRLKKQYREYENFSLFDDRKSFETSQQLFEFISNSFHLSFDPFIRHCECSSKSQTSYISVFSILSKNKENNPYLFNDVAVLLSNNPDVVSVELPKLLQKVAECIEDRDTFCEMSDDEALNFLLNGETEASKKFREFLKQHGHRGYKEVDPMWLQLDDNPLPAIKSLKNMMQSGHKFAEKQLLTPDEIIASLKTDLSATQKFLLKKISLPWCQQGVCLREKSKSLFVRVFNHFRKAFWLLAEMMKNEGLIPEKDLLFYLKVEEVDRLIRNRNPTLVARAKQRKKLFPKMDKFQFGEFVEGPDYTPRNAVDNSIDDEELMSCERVNGLPVCIGVIEGRATVCKDFSEVNDIQSGDILIAYSTDVGWSPYFPLLSGVVTEIGGLVSHGAVIAREYGLPCIVGAKNVTRIFNTGDRVVLDAENGVLYKKSD